MSDVLDCPANDDLVQVDFRCSVDVCDYDWEEVMTEAEAKRCACPRCGGVAIPTNVWAVGRRGRPASLVPACDVDGRDWRFTVFLLGVGVLIVAYYWLMK